MEKESRIKRRIKQHKELRSPKYKYKIIEDKHKQKLFDVRFKEMVKELTTNIGEDS